MRKTKNLRRKRTLGRKRRYSRKRVRTSRKMRGGAVERVNTKEQLERVRTQNMKHNENSRCWIKQGQTFLKELDINKDSDYSQAIEYLNSPGYTVDCL